MSEYNTLAIDEIPDTVYENSESIGQSLPHSPEAEQSVLGGLVLANQGFDAVAEILEAEDFFKDAHRQVFLAMSALSESEKPFDIVTLAEELSRKDELGRVGGLDYLSTITRNTPSSANTLAYARIIREHATVRQLIHVANDISRSSYNPSGLDADDLLQLAEKRLLEIAEGRPKEGGFEAMDTLLKSTLERIDTLFRSKSDITGLSTGLDELDQRTAGWQNGELVILAARPSMGKTALALNFVESAIFTQKKTRAGV